MAPSEVLSAILHYKKNIEKICDSPERAVQYEERLLHCINKLYKLPVNITHLQETGVGKTVNSLRKIQGRKGLGDAAKALVAKWKTMVMLQDAEDRRRKEIVQLTPDAEDIRRIKLIRDAEKSHARKTEDSQKPHKRSHSDKSNKSESKKIKFESLHDGRERKRKYSDEGKSSSDDDCGDRYHSKAKKRSHNSYEEEKEKREMEVEKYSPQYVEPRSYEEPKSTERKKEKTEEKHRNKSEMHKSSSEKSDKKSESKSKHSNSSRSSSTSRCSSSEKSDKKSEPKSKHLSSSSVWDYSEKPDKKNESISKHSNSSSSSRSSSSSEKSDKKSEPKSKHSNSSNSSSSSEKLDKKSEPKSKHSNSSDSSNSSTSSRSSSSSEKRDKKSESKSKHSNSSTVGDYSEKSDKRSESKSKHSNSSSVWDYSEKSDKRSESKSKHSNSSSVWDYSEKSDKKSESKSKHSDSSSVWAYSEKLDKKRESKHSNSSTVRDYSEKSDKRSESKSEHSNSSSVRGYSEKSDKRSESKSKHSNSSSVRGYSEIQDKKSESISKYSNSSSVWAYSEKLEKKSESKHSNLSSSSSKSKSKPDKHESNHISYEKSEAKKSKVSTNVSDDEEGGIDCHSGASFADALGPIIVKKAKKKFSQSVSVSQNDAPGEKVTKEKKPKNQIDITRPPTEPLEPDLISTLPVPIPHYKPSPKNNLSLQEASRKRIQAEEEALNSMISNKNQRTKVYSGVKGGLPFVPTLYECCCRVLQQHLDAIEYTGGIPYSLLKPILDAASPAQLFQFEHFNPYIIEDTDHLWKFHVNKAFRNASRQEFESWREMYLRCIDEREEKYKAVTANIQKSIERSAPVRKAKLAYIDVAKPPRNILRKQIKNGIHKPEAARLLGKNNPEAVKVAPPKQLAAKEPPTIKSKSKVAPLMQKTLKSIKLTRFKR